MFKIIKDEITKHKLIVPNIKDKECWKNYKNRWFRSLHLDENNHIVSLGLQKFMNLEKGSNEFKITKKDIIDNLENDLIATLKIDGSLLIRYVFNNKVCWRTRGSLSVGLDNKNEIDVLCRKNPKLLDPDLYKNQSLIFEWTSPENKIVIDYKEPKITLISGILYVKNKIFSRAEPRLFNFREIKQVSEVLSVDFVKHYFFTNEHDLSKFFDDISSMTGIEGFVFRFNNNQRMVKVKTEQYIALHGIKSHLSMEKIFDMWWSCDCPHYSCFKKQFVEMYDFECFEYAKDLINIFFNAVEDATIIIADIELFVSLRKEDNISRKNFAQQCSTEYKDTELALCFLFYDDKQIPKDLWKKIIFKYSGRPTLKLFD